MLAAAELERWLAAIGLATTGVEALPGDVSARRYLRVHLAGGGTAIAVLYPEELQPACQRFLRSGALLTAVGVRVPEVLAADCARGVMAVEDLGPNTLFDARGLSAEALGAYLESAAAAIERIAGIDPEPVARSSPPLDGALLREELRVTTREALEPRGLVGDRALAARIERAFDQICQLLGAEPLVPCHRDFMVRNLVPVGEPPGVAVLDHQDLRLGPPLYDLASLLEDSICAPPPTRRLLLDRFAAEPEGRSSYRRAAAQRTLKAAGTFARFARKGNERHLALLPSTLGRALGHLAALPETAELAAALAPIWRSALALDG